MCCSWAAAKKPNSKGSSRLAKPGWSRCWPTRWLAAAAIAGFFAKRAQGLRTALVILGAIVVFTGASYGVVVSKNSGVRAPETIQVDGQPYSLQKGKVVLFFFDPFCGTCFAVGQSLAPGQPWVGGFPLPSPRAMGPPWKVDGLKPTLMSSSNTQSWQGSS